MLTLVVVIAFLRRRQHFSPRRDPWLLDLRIKCGLGRESVLAPTHLMGRVGSPNIRVIAIPKRLLFSFAICEKLGFRNPL